MPLSRETATEQRFLNAIYKSTCSKGKQENKKTSDSEALICIESLRPGSIVGKRGEQRGKREIGKPMCADFFAQSTLSFGFVFSLFFNLRNFGLSQFFSKISDVHFFGYPHPPSAGIRSALYRDRGQEIVVTQNIACGTSLPLFNNHRVSSSEM